MHRWPFPTNTEMHTADWQDRLRTWKLVYGDPHASKSSNPVLVVRNIPRVNANAKLLVSRSMDGEREVLAGSSQWRILWVN